MNAGDIFIVGEMAHAMDNRDYDMAMDLMDMLYEEEPIPEYRGHESIPRQPFSWDNYPNPVHLFRFTREEIEALCECFHLLPHMTCQPQGYTTTAVEAMCIVLYHLAYPQRWYDAQRVFNMSYWLLCGIFNPTIRHMSRIAKAVLQNMDMHRIDLYVEDWKAAIEDTGGAIPGVFAFVDGTFRIMTRPGNQEVFYSGYYHNHGLKFQAILTPDGLILTLHGPYPGSLHDNTIFAHSDVDTDLDAIDGIIFGDSAYALGPNVARIWRRPQLVGRDDRRAENVAMSAVRVAVETGFALVTNTYQTLSFYLWQRLGLSPIAAKYIVGAFFLAFRVGGYVFCILCRLGCTCTCWDGHAPKKLQIW